MLDGDRAKFYRCKSFPKDEKYADWKHARGINSRSDEFKCAVGPIFKLIEKAVFKLKWFVKNVPVADRGKFILERLFCPGSKASATDYTAFESLFTSDASEMGLPGLMEKVEFVLYEYMTQFLPDHLEFMRAVHEALGGINFCEFKHFIVMIVATRMSGDMCTSLGNGFTNCICFFFVCILKHLRSQPGVPGTCGVPGFADMDSLAKHMVSCIESIGVDGIFEGDDGIARPSNPIPTPGDFAEIGLNIKLETHDEVSEASFCGQVFDFEDVVVVTDVREVLASTGWAPKRYALSKNSKLKTLLRCKALSLAHQYPGCPVLDAYSKYLLRVTRSHDVRHMINNWRNTYEKEQMLGYLGADIPLVEVPYRTRLLVERLYGISVEHQLRLERWFDEQDDLCTLKDAALVSLCPDSWVEYSRDYVLNWPMKLVDEPPDVWVQNPNYLVRLTVPIVQRFKF